MILRSRTAWLGFLQAISALSAALALQRLQANDLEKFFAAEVAKSEAALVVPQSRLKSDLEPQAEEIWKQLEDIIGPSAATKQADQKRRVAMNAMKQMNPAKLRTRADFDAYDRLTQERDLGELAVKRLEAERRANVRKQAGQSEEGKRLLTALEAIETQTALAQQELDEAMAGWNAAKARLKTYMNGRLPLDPKLEAKPMLKLALPPDAAERARRFASRNSPESLAALAREFFSRMDLQRPGLNQIPAMLAAGRNEAALEVWRDSVFARLQEPRKHGLPAQWGVDIDTISMLRAPEPERLEDAMRGIFSTPKAKALVGPPGAIYWADPGADPVEDPSKHPRLDFYTLRGLEGFVDLLGPHLVLLDGYTATGERRYLDRWVEVMDDWAMNAPGDMENATFNIRQYPVLCSFRPVTFASTLTDVLHARPDFARSMPASTLARVMMTAMEEYPASYARLGRRGIYNWIAIATTGAVLTSQVFPEFHASRWQLAETKRLMELNWSHKILRDGGNLEQGNWGHEPNDQVHLGRAFRLLESQPPAWLDEAWRAEWRDNVKVNARQYLHSMKPDGFTYKFGRVTTSDKFLLHGRLDAPAMPIQSNLLLEEPESRRRLEWLYGKAAAEPPRILSESLAYLGQAFFRSGWEPDASFLYFNHNPNRDTGEKADANGFSMYAHGHHLLLAPPLFVDDRTQDICHGLVRDPGGKTVYLTYDDRDRPVDVRFHAATAFDFAEGDYCGVYRLHPSKADGDLFGDYGYAKLGDALRKKGNADEPIRDVNHRRQILSIRGEDLLIVTDRLQSESERRFAQNYTLFTPVARDGWKRRVELAAEEQRPSLVMDGASRVLRTDSHDLPGLSIRHFGTVQPTYTLLDNAFTKTAKAESVDEALAALGSAKLKKWFMGLPLPFSQKVRAEWSSRGEQIFISAIATRPGELSPQPFGSDLRDAQPLSVAGASGFRATTSRGARVEYLASTRGSSSLALGPLQVEAEALAVITRGQSVTGMVLDCTKGDFRGKALPSGDFEFSVSGQTLTTVPIHRPIQAVKIVPEITGFVGSLQVELNCPTFGMEIRYTIDGTDPTLESALYTAPFTIHATTRVKARAFRQGLKETPWTASCTEASAIAWTTFEQQTELAAVSIRASRPGLKWEYVEGRWPELFVNAARLPASKSGASPLLLDVSMRGTDGAFAVRASGYLNVPADGVYTFHAPREFLFPDQECGYDLRLQVHGREWQPVTRRHAHGTWSIALKKGAHPVRVVFTDFRTRPLKPVLWDDFPHPDIVWKGTVPAIEVSGPGTARQPISTAWLQQPD